MSKKERRVIEEKVRQIMREERRDEVRKKLEAWKRTGAPIYAWQTEEHVVSTDMLRCLQLDEIIWKSENGDIIFSYKDGEKTVQYSNVGICLLTAEGKPFLGCLPCSLKNAP